MSFRRLRLRSAWLLILPFFYFASPRPGLMAAGVTLSALGLVVRAWAAGTIHKDRVLTTGGPYSYTRNPLYLGSLFLGFGVVVAGAVVWFAALFAGFYAKDAYQAGLRETPTRQRSANAKRLRSRAVPMLVGDATPPYMDDGGVIPFKRMYVTRLP